MTRSSIERNGHPHRYSRGDRIGHDEYARPLRVAEVDGDEVMAYAEDDSIPVWLDLCDVWPAPDPDPEPAPAEAARRPPAVEEDYEDEDDYEDDDDEDEPAAPVEDEWFTELLEYKEWRKKARSFTMVSDHLHRHGLDFDFVFFFAYLLDYNEHPATHHLGGWFFVPAKVLRRKFPSLTTAKRNRLMKGLSGQQVVRKPGQPRQTVRTMDVPWLMTRTTEQMRNEFGTTKVSHHPQVWVKINYAFVLSSWQSWMKGQEEEKDKRRPRRDW